MLTRSVAAQPLGVEKNDVLAGLILQPDDKVGIIGVIVEERHAPAARQVADKKQFLAVQAGVAVFRQRGQLLNDVPFILVQGNRLIVTLLSGPAYSNGL